MLRLLEGFESYGTLGRSGSTLRDDLNRGHYLSSSNIELVTGRGGSGLALETSGSTNISLYFSRFDPFQSDTWIMGFAVQVVDSVTSSIDLWYEDGSGLLLTILPGGNGEIDQTSWTTPESVPLGLKPARWYYIEIKFVAHNTTGTIEIRLDGQTVYTASNVDTQNSNRVSGGNFRLRGHNSSSLSMVYDDVYICDGSGSYNNNFLGPVTVETLRPTSDEGSQNWTPSSGVDHYAMVNSANMWQNTDYVEAATPVDNLWGYPSLGIVNGSVHGVQVISTGWTDTGLPQSLQTICDSGATVDYSASRGLGADQNPTPLDSIWETDPNTSLPWTIANLNIASFGIRKV